MASGYEVLVVGGGLVGAALAYGIARRRRRVAMLDEGDVALRAARGNFGLVWVQGKGLDFPAYAHWTRLSADIWGNFADELQQITGTNIAYSQTGGLHICRSEAEYHAREEALQRLREQTGGRFRFEMLDHSALTECMVGVAEQVPGASYCAQDGHVNPLYLLRALHDGFRRFGGQYLPNRAVDTIEHDGNTFVVHSGGERIHGERIALTAGLGNKRLAPTVGLRAPVLPNRGQVLVSERVRPLLRLPTVHLRQTVEGSLLMGDSHEDVGFDEGTTGAVMAEIARRSVWTFPFLAQVRLVRAWGALRVMTPDGVPIYEASARFPGAFVACCHSGVTLAAAHAEHLAAWVTDDQVPVDIEHFTAERFDVQAAA